jgi:hypothetical protein
VKTKSGAIYSGEVEERGNVVTVNIRGVITRLPKADVDSIEYQEGTIDEEIETRRAKLAPEDLKGRLELARLALDHQMFDKALELALEAVQIDPKDEEAIAVRQTIRMQKQQYQAKQRAGAVASTSDKPVVARTTTAPAPNPTTTSAPTTNGERKFLTPDDIQQIRRKELKPGDNARVQITQDVKRSFAARMGIPFNQFNARPAIDQALAIMKDGDDQMISQIKVTSDPESIVEFKRLQPMVLTGCATSNCHGSISNIGGFMLHVAENDPATYTNFYILTQYSKNVADGGDQGVFSGVSERRLVERAHGERSLLAQYGLAPNKATLKHPKIIKGNAFNGIFRDQEDQRYRRLVDWMNNSLSTIAPTYNINYPVHRAAPAGPTTIPATLPTTLPPGTARPPARPPGTTRPTR